jgi:hypothetical protein
MRVEHNHLDNDSLVLKHELMEVKKDLKSICVEKIELM